MSRTYAGVTLLFSQKQSGAIEAQLKSYVLNATTRSILHRKIKNLSTKEEKKGLEYFGVHDIFYVSGKFKRGAVLGVSYIPEYRTIAKAKGLTKTNKYAYAKAVEKKIDWCIASVVYFYQDPSKGTNLVVTCLTPIEKTSLAAMKSALRKVAEDMKFKRKIFTQIDGLNSKLLHYIGIEEIGIVRENPSKGEAFEILYRDFKTNKQIQKILPSLSELKKKVWW